MTTPASRKLQESWDCHPSLHRHPNLRAHDSVHAHQMPLLPNTATGWIAGAVNGMDNTTERTDAHKHLVMVDVMAITREAFDSGSDLFSGRLRQVGRQ